MLANSYRITREITSKTFQTQVPHATARTPISIEGSLVSRLTKSALKTSKKSAPTSFLTTEMMPRASSTFTATNTTTKNLLELLLLPL